MAGRGWGWSRRPPPRRRCCRCGSLLEPAALRKEKRRTLWWCLACLAERDAPIAEHARRLAAEALGWTGGYATAHLGLARLRPVEAPNEYTPAVVVERYRADGKVDQHVIAVRGALIDPYATLATVNRAIAEAAPAR